ncbi:Tartrate-resistant acid phosphatase type 5 [Aphelenchoides fujianensis]|nr:Tartrate-resistant acid phosphatase type 5 [Aphelenchoides fujianensis]KAI6232643.1 Tartrate-resistant acid phosphatase type 5 [Aphelenchoides fujianensis]
MRTHCCLFPLLILSLLVSTALSAPLSPAERTVCTKGIQCVINKNQLDFFVVGDTGGVELHVTETLSHVRPTPVQTRLADSMAKLAGKKKLDFVINVGDNVYFNGVDHENDTRFQSVFEEPYADKRLQVPWYTIAGNHDYLGNVTAQIEYTKRSDKWTFPAPYYKASYAFAKMSKTVDIIFLDSVIMCGNSIDVDSRSLFSWMRAVEKVPERPDPEHVKEAKKQWAWFERELKNSKADYLFVVGHYPVYSISLQRLKCLEDRLDPLLRKYHVTAYIAGHDHSLQYFRDESGGKGPKMHYLVSGAGSRTGAWGDYKGDDRTKLIYRYPKQPYIPLLRNFVRKRNEFGFGYGGFVHFSVRTDRADLGFYVRDQELEFQESIRPRAKKNFG